MRRLISIGLLLALLPANATARTGDPCADALHGIAPDGVDAVAMFEIGGDVGYCETFPMNCAG